MNDALCEVTRGATLPGLNAGEIYIYALTDPVTREVRYVGQSVRPDKRYLAHRSLCIDFPDAKNRWLEHLRKKKLAPRMWIMDITPIPHANEAEKWYVHYFVNQGNSLLNRRFHPEYIRPKSII